MPMIAGFQIHVNRTKKDRRIAEYSSPINEVSIFFDRIVQGLAEDQRIQEIDQLIDLRF